MILPEGALMRTHISSADAFVSTFQDRPGLFSAARASRSRMQAVRAADRVVLAPTKQAERYVTRNGKKKKMAVNVP